MFLGEGMAEFIAAATRNAAGHDKALTYQSFRNRLESAATATPAYPEGLAASDHFITAPGREIPIRVYRPGAATASGTLIYFHGGGWVAGSIHTHDAVAARIAHGSGVHVISVHYRRAPESPCPAPVDDGQAVLEWLLTDGSALGLNAELVGVCGDSAGAHIATALAHRVRSDSRHRLSCQILVYPAIEPDFTTDSYRDYRDGPLLSRDDMERFWNWYVGEDGDTTNPDRFPGRTTNLTGLPPTLIVSAQHDPLRDDGINYAARLEKAGVTVETRLAPGMIHGFLRAAAVSSAAAAEVDLICAYIRKHLTADRQS